jgi:hypothetical protein
MLAQLEPPTNDFHVLARYLIHGRERPTNPDRVAWIMAHNLGTDDPELVATLMTATAQMSKRCKNACYHAMIAWREDERPSPDVMQEIARKTLELAGLAEHQALVVGHGDKAHPHLHMMVNRVHPETGRAWSTSHDYRRFDHIIKLLSEEYGFLYVPPHSFNPEMTDELPKGPTSKAVYAAKRGARTDRPQWSRRSARTLGTRVNEELEIGASWDDVEFALAEEGLAVEPKGKGLIVGNSRGYHKLSSLGLKATASGLRRKMAHRRATRRPPVRKPLRRNVWSVDAVDVARAIGTREHVRQAVQDATRMRLARRARFSLMRQLTDELKDDLRASTHLRRPQLVRARRTKSRHSTNENSRLL